LKQKYKNNHIVRWIWQLSEHEGTLTASCCSKKL